MRLFDSTTISALQQTAAFTERRHELLASNLANLDTPDYRARDLPVDRFQAALAESIEQGKNPSPGNSSSGSPSVGDLIGGARKAVRGPHGEGLFGSAVQRDDIAVGPRDSMEPIVLHDGSDVSLERQVTDMAKNQGLHSLAIATMRNQFAMLRAAISERP